MAAGASRREGVVQRARDVAEDAGGAKRRRAGATASRRRRRRRRASAADGARGAEPRRRAHRACAPFTGGGGGANRRVLKAATTTARCGARRAADGAGGARRERGARARARLARASIWAAVRTMGTVRRRRCVSTKTARESRWAPSRARRGGDTAAKQRPEGRGGERARGHDARARRRRGPMDEVAVVDERGQASRARRGARATSNGAHGRVTSSAAINESRTQTRVLNGRRRPAPPGDYNNDEDERTNERTNERSLQAGDARVRRVEARELRRLRCAWNIEWIRRSTHRSAPTTPARFAAGTSHSDPRALSTPGRSG